jgi:hypothetical protein
MAFLPFPTSGPSVPGKSLRIVVERAGRLLDRRSITFSLSRQFAEALIWGIRITAPEARHRRGLLQEALHPTHDARPTQASPTPKTEAQSELVTATSLSAPIPIGRAFTESRIAVDDGHIWPFERTRMIAPGAIRERMVEDIVTLVQAGGDDAVVSIEDLGRQGWTQAHLDAHAAKAFAHYRAQHCRPRPLLGSDDAQAITTRRARAAS